MTARETYFNLPDHTDTLRAAMCAYNVQISLEFADRLREDESMRDNFEAELITRYLDARCSHD